MKSICIILTDPDSINEQIILNSLNKLKKSKLKKIYLLGDSKLFPKLFKKVLKSKKINFFNVNLKQKNYLKYLHNLTDKSLELFDKKKIQYLINMPLNKKKFLKNKFLGFTEFISHKIDRKKNENMLLFNKSFSVCPLTTHEQIKNVYKKINKKVLINAIENIIYFYKKILKFKDTKIIVLGLNPHASIDTNKASKDNNCIKPVVKFFKKKKIDISGPVSADTAFINTENKIFLGMYHDQVLIPFKMKNKFNGINITIGKKIIRLSPDHGTGTNLKNKIKNIDNTSFIECIKFCEKY